MSIPEVDRVSRSTLHSSDIPSHSCRTSPYGTPADGVDYLYVLKIYSWFGRRGTRELEVSLDHKLSCCHSYISIGVGLLEVLPMRLTFPLTSRRKPRLSIGRSSKVGVILSGTLAIAYVLLVYLGPVLFSEVKKDTNDRNSNIGSSNRIITLGMDSSHWNNMKIQGNHASVALRHFISSTELEPLLRPVDYEKYTIRINTYRRNEQLLVSLNHHTQCEGVAQIQVIWCDSENDPPSEITNHPSGKVIVERHSHNSLNERFHILLPTPTAGIFSMDDDVLRPCQAIDAAFFLWTRNPERMVGYDPRLHVVTTTAATTPSDGNGEGQQHPQQGENTNQWQYGALSVAERTGMYSMVLTRSVFLHRDYLNLYVNTLPKTILDRIDTTFNCEDIAMTLLVSAATNGKPPLLASLWARKTLIKLYHVTAISGEATNDGAKQEEHRQLRNHCVHSFSEELGLQLQGSTQLQSIPFHVQYSSIEEYEDSPFLDDTTAPIASSTSFRVPREVSLVNQWTTTPSKYRLVEQWITEASTEAKRKGLITKTKEWKARWDSNTLVSLE